MESQKKYADPFNDVDVDVIFSKEGQSWRVPTFWRGGQKWTVRFAPPLAGDYAYRLQSTDPSNPDLNGHEGRITIAPYTGHNPLFRHGMLRISASQRYFEHVDGAPFFWLGDTWWTGLSDRLSWPGFQKLAADRKAKGFTVVQIVAGLVPFEELAPTDPGFQNEGGAVWEAKFARINPGYFDAADRRIQHLLDTGMVPAIVGAWSGVLGQMGIKKMEQHWRYIVARYGAYPCFLVAGGEVIDPPPEMRSHLPDSARPYQVSGWTEVTKYIRSMDPYRHPLSVHEASPPADFPLQDERLSDFDLLQSGHGSWSSLAAEVAQIGVHYARTTLVKPVVQGEIGYETLGEEHYANFQRAAFWLSMLNGAAGHTYGANGTWEAYAADKPLHRLRWSFMSWEEGMNLPGSYQIGLGAKLLRQYRWWLFVPHPEWVTPSGTTLLEPNEQVNGFDLGVGSVYDDGAAFPAGLWKSHGGDFRKPYAAGIPGEVRFVYMASFGVKKPTPPTILGLESGVRYRAYLWDPTRGIQFDLGSVERPPPGITVLNESFTRETNPLWAEKGTARALRKGGVLSAEGETLSVLPKVQERNAVAAVDAKGDAQAGLLLRYHDPHNYVAAVYSPEEKSLYLLDRRGGDDGEPLGKTAVPAIDSFIRLSAEVRDNKGIASLSDGKKAYTTPIVDLATLAAGSVGLLHRGKDSVAQSFDNFELRRSPVLAMGNSPSRTLYDAHGEHRGNLVGSATLLGPHMEPGWESFGRDKHILLDAYRPERMPTAGDWVLVLEAGQSAYIDRATVLEAGPDQ